MMSRPFYATSSPENEGIIPVFSSGPAPPLLVFNREGSYIRFSAALP